MIGQRALMSGGNNVKGVNFLIAEKAEQAILINVTVYGILDSARGAFVL